MESKIKDRVAEFVHHKHLTMAEFERRCGLSNGYISSMRQSFGAVKLDKVLKAFPDLSREWLLYGEGEMLQDLEQRSIVQNVEQNNSHGNIVTATLNETNKFLDLLMEKEKSLERAQAHLSTAQAQITQLINLLAK